MKALLFCLLLSACGGVPANTETSYVPDPHPNDTGTIAIVDSNPLVDTSSACVNKKEQPSSYPRLIERWCETKYGDWFINDYLDNQLNIGCRWKTSSDETVRCLPTFYQSSWFYTDNKCSVAVAMVDDNQPYVGLEKNGTITIFHTGKKFIGMANYSLSLMGSDWNCSESFMGFPGNQSVYVGEEVDPSIFQKQ